MLKTKEEIKKEYPGLCSCGRILDFRYTDFKEDENNIMTILGFIVYGFCEDCKKIFLCGIFTDTKLPPELDVDFKINYKKKMSKKDKRTFKEFKQSIKGKEKNE